MTRIANWTVLWESLCTDGAACLHADGLLLEVAYSPVCVAVLRVSIKRCAVLNVWTMSDLQISCFAGLAAVQLFVAECTHCLSVGLGALDAFEGV